MNESLPTGSVDPASAQAPAATRTSGLAITALVLGIPGLCLLPLGLVALILGIVALVQIADPKRGLSGKGMAITGTILGGLSIVLVPFLLVIITLPALGAARRTAKSVQDMSTLRQTGVMVMMYSADYDDDLPGHPRDFLPYLNITPQEFFISAHHDPATVLDRGDSDGPAVRYGSYVYILPPMKFEEIPYPGDTVLAYTAKVQGIPQERAVLFADGHVERMDDTTLQGLLPDDVVIDAYDEP